MLGASPDTLAPDNFPKHYTKKQIDSIMNEWSVSLGVKCNFCHARNADTNLPGLNYDSEKKPEKRMARRMYQMTVSLNATYFNFNNSTDPDTIHIVVCYTCHRGQSKPNVSAFAKQLDSIERTMHRQ